MVLQYCITSDNMTIRFWSYICTRQAIKGRVDIIKFSWVFRHPFSHLNTYSIHTISDSTRYFRLLFTMTSFKHRYKSYRVGKCAFVQFSFLFRMNNCIKGKGYTGLVKPLQQSIHLYWMHIFCDMWSLTHYFTSSVRSVWKPNMNE